MEKPHRRPDDFLFGIVIDLDRSLDFIKQPERSINCVFVPCINTCRDSLYPLLGNIVRTAIADPIVVVSRNRAEDFPSSCRCQSPVPAGSGPDDFVFTLVVRGNWRDNFRVFG